MSGTETILLIVLGFSLASLIALFLGRMVWTAGVKVGARRMQRQVPSSLVGLQTERDRLRAEYAMLAQRLGTRLEEAKLRLAESMAEVSRHRNRFYQVESSEGTRTAELRLLQARVKELEAALADSKSQQEDLRQSLAAKEEALRKLRKKRGYQGRETPPPADPEIRLRQRIDKLAELAKSTTAAGDAPTPEDEQSIEGKLAEAERQTRELETELKRLESEWSHPPRQDTPDPSPTSDNVIPLPNRARDFKTGTSSPS